MRWTGAMIIGFSIAASGCRHQLGSCATTADCAPPASACSAGRCVIACADNPDGCPAGTACEPATGVCSSILAQAGDSCTVDGDCAPPHLLCDQQSGTCAHALGDGGAMADDLAGPIDLSPGVEIDGSFPGGCGVKVNEVQTAGIAGPDDEFVELFNSCPSPIDLAGFRLVYRSSTGMTDRTMVRFGASRITPGGFLVCGQNRYPGPADVRYGASMASPGGSVGLHDPRGTRLDAVAWGKAMNGLVEGSPAVAPAVAKSIQRLPDGHDTDDNSVDFVESAPTPGGPNQ